NAPERLARTRGARKPASGKRRRRELPEESRSEAVLEAQGGDFRVAGGELGVPLVEELRRRIELLGEPARGCLLLRQLSGVEVGEGRLDLCLESHPFRSRGGGRYAGFLCRTDLGRAARDRRYPRRGRPLCAHLHLPVPVDRGDEGGRLALVRA